MHGKQTKILKQVLDYAYMSRDEHLFFCPFCKHHNPKLSVNVKKNCFKCWVCDVRGKDNYYLVKRFGMFDAQQEWLKITNQTDIRDFEVMFSGSYQQEKVKQKIDLPEEYKPLSSCSKFLYSKRPLNYLRSRGLDYKKMFEWKIGFCDKGKYKNRIIIPSFDSEGDVNYFISRSYDGSNRKYKNPPVSKDIIFNDLLIDWSRPVVLVEGVFDARHELNMIPVLGSTLSESSELFQKIVEKEVPVYIAFDHDALDKEMKLVRNLLRYGIEVKKMTLPRDKDLGEITKKEYFEIKKMSEYIKFEHFFELISI
jgi:DNA primase